MDAELLKRKALELGKIPLNQLTEEEYGLMIAGYILIDAETSDSITLRNYTFGWASPREILKLIKPHLPIIQEELKKLGFIRASKYGWRRFKADIPWERVKMLAEKSRLTEDEAYVLYVAWRLLRRTIPFIRDWKGYNIVHAFAIHDRLWKPAEEFTREDVEWIRRRLVKYYRDQILELGLDFKRLLTRGEGEGDAPD